MKTIKAILSINIIQLMIKYLECDGHKSDMEHSIKKVGILAQEAILYYKNKIK